MFVVLHDLAQQNAVEGDDELERSLRVSVVPIGTQSPFDLSPANGVLEFGITEQS